MVKVIRREVRRRGFFGWLFLVIFLLFNAFMALVMWLGVSGVVDTPTGPTESHRTGQTIGAAIGIGSILLFWALGSVVTGLLAMLTRGRKTIVEETIEG